MNPTYRIPTLLALLITLLVMPSTVDAQSAPAGAWEGKLELPNGGLRIVFNITEKAGQLTATMDSPGSGCHGYSGCHDNIRKRYADPQTQLALAVCTRGP